MRLGTSAANLEKILTVDTKPRKTVKLLCNNRRCGFNNSPKFIGGEYRCEGCKDGRFTVSKRQADAFWRDPEAYGYRRPYLGPPIHFANDISWLEEHYRRSRSVPARFKRNVLPVFKEKVHAIAHACTPAKPREIHISSPLGVPNYQQPNNQPRALEDELVARSIVQRKESYFHEEQLRALRKSREGGLKRSQSMRRCSPSIPPASSACRPCNKLSVSFELPRKPSR
ncbi:hypothetical protein FISHEDRAFT_58547 [Fistulina hepatica ATCC 64428]|uniref:Uncharacterized protein n=1 Tax=Fistulina hepatica ATCC 64428 TaxID=1128425 RepID=A0A0D7ADU7_9AGAR|nr:hypothetical protein FISHEDRAFT_58547 [Fistulina hepatica ATCC 64428]